VQRIEFTASDVKTSDAAPSARIARIEGLMNIAPFKLERYFAQHEFSAPYLLSPSDCESLTLDELLGLADSVGQQLWRELRLGYTDSQGHPMLRQEVAALYETLSADDVLIAAPEEAIFIAMNVLLEPGDHVIVTFPGYQSLYEIAQALGCRVTRWTLEVSEGEWALDFGALAASITPQTRMLVINFPHNPTGFLPTRAQLDHIIELARDHDLVLFSDEMYRWLEYEPRTRLPAVCDRYEKGISLSGLSKTFALPGLRIGWLATGDDDLLAKMQVYKDYTTICNSAPSEALAIIALRARDEIQARSLDIIRNNLRLVEAFFAEHDDWLRWLSPRAGSVAFPHLLRGAAVESFCSEALREQGVMIVPGTLFDYPGDHFRLGLGRMGLGLALERLGAFLQGR
jgi:aspartate/methionine/tyrosine aminotransferase